MRRFLGVVSCLVLSVLLCSCDDKMVSDNFLSQLKPYFTNAQIHLLPEQHTAVGVTCVYGAGPQMIELAKAEVAKASSSAQQWNALSPMLKGTHTYRYFVLMFDSTQFGYDINTHAIGENAMTDSMKADYDRMCGGTSSVAKTGTYVWRGTFTAIIRAPEAQQPTAYHFVDSLGIYRSDADFDRRRSAEVKARMDLVRDELTQKGDVVIDMMLDSVDKIPIPR